MANGDKAAFHRYEELLCPYIVGKQNAAVRFASSFAPKTRLGLTLRHIVMRTFRIPMIAKFAIGGDLVADQLKLPQYTFCGPATASECASFRCFCLVDLGYNSKKALKVFYSGRDGSSARCSRVGYNWHF